MDYVTLYRFELGSIALLIAIIWWLYQQATKAHERLET
jgi:hypothetical protein